MMVFAVGKFSGLVKLFRRLSHLVRVFTVSHSWKLNSPGDRICSVCGRREVFNSYSVNFWIQSWWSVLVPGDLERHYD